MKLITSLAFFITGASAAIDAPAGTQAATLPNVILIMADDLGYAEVSLYGKSLVPTPHLDKLAQSGVLFTYYHSNGQFVRPRARP